MTAELQSLIDLAWDNAPPDPAMRRSCVTPSST